MPAEGSPASGSTRVLSVDLTPERADDAVEALRQLVGRLPVHPGILPLTGVSVADGRLVVVTPHVPGDALDRALQLYGPAAVGDALPRVRQIASALDLAASEGLCHGALHPRDIIVSADDTRVTGLGVADALARVDVGMPLETRYAAPEVLTSGVRTPAGDQYSLAVIAHEWMFADAVTPADGFLAVPSQPGINSAAMQRALEIATATDPARRFGTCLEFAAALERTTEVDTMLALSPPERLERIALRDDAEFTDGASRAFGTAPVAGRRHFGVVALIATLIVGMMIGAVAMRLLYVPQTVAFGSMAPTPNEVSGPTEVVDTLAMPPRDDALPLPAPRPPTDAASAAQADGGLLVHSTPAGAVVIVDGVSRGTTPVAVRGLALGTRRVEVSRPGYQATERQVTLTAARPSRTVDVDLVSAARSSALPAAAPRSAASGSLVVDSRPAGALVAIDGRPVGSTPVTVTGLSPGRRTVRIELAGYRTVTTAVSVKAGERARVAARLEGGSNDE